MNCVLDELRLRNLNEGFIEEKSYGFKSIGSNNEVGVEEKKDVGVSLINLESQCSSIKQFENKMELNTSKQKFQNGDPSVQIT